MLFSINQNSITPELTRLEICIAFSVVSDIDKNIVLYTYQPEALESFGGHYLLRKGDIHIGSHINSFLRIRCKLSDLQNDKKALMTFEKRHMTFYFTQDGSIGAILPVSEKVYRRLLMLQNLMATNVPHVAGLNPRAYRFVLFIFRRTIRTVFKNQKAGPTLIPVLHCIL